MTPPDGGNILRVLSAAPWFDTETATELLGLAEFADESAQEVLARVRRSGLLVRDGEVERVQEPNRSEWRQALFADDSELYRAALEIFARRSRSSLGDRLTDVLGTDGTFLTTRAIECVSYAEPAEALDDLVSRLEDGPDQWDPVTAVAVARLIELYGFKRDRLSDFFEGLALWSNDRRDEAASYFRRVVADRKQDRAGAISEHLLGVVMYQTGDLFEAEAVLEDAISHLEGLNDRKGLEVTLCTYGRVQHSIYKRNGDLEALARSRIALERALGLATDESPRKARTLQYLARTVGDYGEYPVAIALAEQAVELADDAVSAMNSRTTLALLYRDAAMVELYLETIEDAAEIAEKYNVRGKTLARTLNMAAAAYRRVGDYRAAIRLALRSIRVGEQLADDRHVAHAQHTLAATRIDSLHDGRPDPTDIAEILDLLNRSRNTLAGFHDVRGVGLVDATASRLYARFNVNRDTRSEE